MYYGSGYLAFIPIRDILGCLYLTDGETGFDTFRIMLKPICYKHGLAVGRLKQIFERIKSYLLKWTIN